MFFYNILILNQKYFNFCLKVLALWKMSKILHCVKSVRIWSYSGPHFSAFGLNSERYEVLSVFSPNVGKCGPE